ncbi:MAG: rhodanese-like domain-containing protein [Bacteroidaceae bacterium]
MIGKGITKARHLAMGKCLAIAALSMSSCTPSFLSVEPGRFRQAMEHEGSLLIDVRHVDEYEDGHIPGAMLVDIADGDFCHKVDSIVGERSAAGIPTDTILVYCKGGIRSREAAEMLSGKGYNVIDLNGGFLNWSKQ